MVPSMNPDTAALPPSTKTSALRTSLRWLGGLMCFAGLSCAASYWLFILPWLQGKFPEYTPHLSMQGYWEAKQPHLKWGPWWNEDGNVVGVFGGKEWAERLMQWIAEGKEMQNFQNVHWEEALPVITNHEFDFSNSGKAWQEWWKDNHSKTQEEWIQAGFEKLGVEVGMPPTEKDWPQLLALLKTAPAPASAEEKDHARPSQKYHHSFHVRYNAYRWLRDSGFDPVTYILSDQPGGSAELLNGAQQWWEMDKKDMRALFSAPPPGQLQFAPKTGWGFSGEPVSDRPPIGPPQKSRFAVTTICAVLCLAGGWMLRRRPVVSSKTA